MMITDIMKSWESSTGIASLLSLHEETIGPAGLSLKLMYYFRVLALRGLLMPTFGSCRDWRMNKEDIDISSSCKKDEEEEIGLQRIDIVPLCNPKKPSLCPLYDWESPALRDCESWKTGFGRPAAAAKRVANTKLIVSNGKSRGPILRNPIARQGPLLTSCNQHS